MHLPPFFRSSRRLLSCLCFGLLAVGMFGADSRGAETASEALARLMEDNWQRTLRENPISASMRLDRRYNDRWPDLSEVAFSHGNEATKTELEQLRGINRKALKADEQISHDMFQTRLEQRLEGFELGIRGGGSSLFLAPLNHRGESSLQTLDLVQSRIPMATVEDHEDWIARLRALGAYVDQHMVILTEGMKRGFLPPKVLMERLPRQIARQIVDDPEQSPFYGPFMAFPDHVPRAERARLAAAGRAAIAEVVLPAYRRFQKFFDQVYLPASRASHGVWDLPRGGALYAFLVRRYTTTDLTPDEVHELGLREVARLRAKMLKVLEDVGFDGGLAEFGEFLRQDKRFYYDSGEQLFEAYLATAKRIDPGLVGLFGKLPRMPYGIRAIPDAIAPDTTTAYYFRPSPDGTRPGYFYVNLYRPETRPKFEIEALTVHEAVPGHHLQIALAAELEGLPDFRRYGSVTAFTEGWALYSESLGYDLGLYKDPYSRFGQLTYEMWRAIRLVVDTGLHHKRWRRGKAIAYFKENSARPEQDIVNEIDRYLIMPGQALAYKIGQMKIEELRRRAAAKLGGGFDIRAFHDVVLGSGAVPLDILEKNVEAYMAAAVAGD